MNITNPIISTPCTKVASDVLYDYANIAFEHLKRFMYNIGENRQCVIHYKWLGYYSNTFWYKDIRQDSTIGVVNYTSVVEL